MSARDCSSWQCGTESKVFLMSKKTVATWRHVVRHWCQSLVIVKRASWVDDLGLNPNWHSERRSCSVRKSMTLLWMHLSSSFEIRDRRDIGW